MVEKEDTCSGCQVDFALYPIDAKLYQRANKLGEKQLTSNDILPFQLNVTIYNNISTNYLSNLKHCCRLRSLYHASLNGNTELEKLLKCNASHERHV